MMNDFASLPHPDKPTLRRSLLKSRQSLDVQTWQAKSLQLCDRLQALPQFINAKTILAYFSVRQEPDLSSLFHLDKTWGFPRCVATDLIWHYWSPQSCLPLQTGAFGIREPHPETPVVDAQQVDLMLVPAIACDQGGYRLGYGGGFYDRCLSNPTWTNMFTIGIVFDFARLAQLPHDSWDLPLQGVCTEISFFASP
jgi:5-formyltetrahydrofolate cyclo-ligase